MVSIFSLWLPILLAAVAVFVASSVIHMVLPYHRSDFKRVPSEDAAMDALRPLNIPPGDYVMPRAETSAEMKSAEYLDKVNKGPVVMMTVVPNGPPAMGAQLAQWLVFCIVVGVFAAYVTGRVVGPGPEQYLLVFRIAGTTAFGGYALALLQNSIWYRRNWSATLKSVFDGLIYASLTGGVFGAFWPE